MIKKLIEGEEISMMEMALELYDMGFELIPLKGPSHPIPKQFLEECGNSEERAKISWYKRPCTEWTRYQLEEVTRENILHWWQRWPDANIGILTKNLIVVDADKLEAVQICDQNLDTPLVSKTQKGKHYLFRAAEDLTIKNSVNRELGIDIRAKGGYIVAPPSLHGSGIRYEWEYPENFESVSDLPLIDSSGFNDLVGRLGLDSSASLKIKADENTPAQKGERNQSLAVLVGRWINQNLLQEQILANALTWNKLNNPPLGISEVLKTCESVIKTHESNHPLIQVQTQVNEPEIPIDDPEEEPDIVDAQDKFPTSLLAPDGFMGRFVEWVNRTSIRPQPILALGSAITVFGTIFGRLIEGPTQLRTNFYTVGIADTGAGKEHARKCIQNLLTCLDMGHHLGGDEIGSDSGLIRALTDEPNTIFLLDEFGKILKSLNNAGNHQSYLKNITSVLLKMFSQASQIYQGKELGDRKQVRQPIIEPNCCIYGTTTPAHYWRSMSNMDIDDGFFNRFLVFVSESGMPEKNVHLNPQKLIPDEELIKDIQSWQREFKRAAEKQNGNCQTIGGILRPNVFMLKYSQDAFLELETFEDQVTKTQYIKPETWPLWTRAHEHARKIALLYAATDCSEVIEYKHARYGISLINYLITNVQRHVKENLSNSEFEQDLKTMLKIIETSKKKGVTKSELTRKSQHIKTFQRDDMIRTLLDSDQICAITDSKPVQGKPAQRFFSKKYMR